MDNGNGPYSVPLEQESIFVYDKTPKEIRDILKYASVSINAASANQYATTHGIDGIKARLEQLTKEDAKLAYGPDHPQAQ